MPIVRTVLDFLELRPVFRRSVLDYVLVALRHFQTLYRDPLDAGRALITAHGPASNALPLSSNSSTRRCGSPGHPVHRAVCCSRFCLRYLMPDLAATTPRDTTLGQELLAFLDLRPFFTHWWTQVFWWLYMLTFLRSVYPYFAFMSPWAAA